MILVVYWTKVFKEFNTECKIFLVATEFSVRSFWITKGYAASNVLKCGSPAIAKPEPTKWNMNEELKQGVGMCLIISRKKWKEKCNTDYILIKSYRSKVNGYRKRAGEHLSSTKGTNHKQKGIKEYCQWKLTF